MADETQAQKRVAAEQRVDHLKRINREKNLRNDQLDFEDVQPLLHSVSHALRKVASLGVSWSVANRLSIPTMRVTLVPASTTGPFEDNW